MTKISSVAGEMVIDLRLPAPRSSCGDARTAPDIPTPTSASPTGDPLLRLVSVSKRWKKSSSPILDAVDLDVPMASAVWIGGRNGAGKTTLLRVIAGLIAPDSGHVYVGDVRQDSERRIYQSRVGFLSAGSTGLYARLTVGQHLRCQSSLDLLSRAARKQAIARELERFSLAHLVGSRADRLSTGQRQRLRLALVMLRNPDVLLLDEPENGLDVDSIARLRSTIVALVTHGGIVLWCSPKDDFDALRFGYRFIISKGKLVAA
jgi:ABC-type multidrug transport system ATPase subunit